MNEEALGQPGAFFIPKSVTWQDTYRLLIMKTIVITGNY